MSCKQKQSPENQHSAYKVMKVFIPGFFYITEQEHYHLYWKKGK